MINNDTDEDTLQFIFLDQHGNSIRLDQATEAECNGVTYLVDVDGWVTNLEALGQQTFSGNHRKVTMRTLLTN